MSSLHQHAKDLFLEALGRPPAERSVFLADACGTDAALRKEVESLLAFHSDANSAGAEPNSGDNWSGSEPATGEQLFAPGDVFAGRYRMIARIGRGGMGDVWRADDLVLHTPVALKLIRSPGPEARQRILNEVRLARQITHPAVCRVFDVGADGDRVFFTMELVEGENLATLLRRVSRLPQERVVQIGQQLCAGLAAAHAQGVLHRDLKPANILIDDAGRVLITDFGIAVSLTDRDDRVLVGTPDYMAPEQLVPGTPLTERTDVYALGLVLYELLVGQHPFNRGPATGAPTKPSTRVPNVDRDLEWVILDAINTDPRRRPESASAFAARLAIGPSVDARSTSTRWAGTAAVAALVVAIVAAAAFLVPKRGPTLSAQDVIVLADFANTTGEPVFDGALKVALAVALEQSPFLRVFSDDRVHETLRLMGRPADAAVTRPIAREIAQRQELKAFVAGSIARLGRNYVVALEAVNAQTGDAMARQQVEVASKEEVLTALGRAVSSMRETLGESLASIARFDSPLPRATTSSLEALHAYSLALDSGTVNPRIEALPHLQRALELDPQFALALAFTAAVYANNGQTGLAAEFAKKAYDLRDRVSERERFFIAFRYYRDGIQDWEQALDLARSWTGAYAGEAFAFNGFGAALGRFSQYEAAIGTLREALRLDPDFPATYGNLAVMLIAANRFDEAREVLTQATERQRESSASRRMDYAFSFMQGDTARLAQLWQSWQTLSNPTKYGWRAHTLTFGGQIAAAHETFRTGIDAALRAGLTEVAAQMATEDAEAHALVGQCGEAVREALDAVTIARDNFTLERAARALALCGSDEGGRIAREVETRNPKATFTQRVAVPVVAAAMAHAQRQPARALELLEEVGRYDLSWRAELWPFYLRGLAYLDARNARAAAEQFRRLIDQRGLDPDSQLFPLAHLGLARASVLAGDTATAIAMYDRFLSLWSQADRTLGPLAAARNERAKLGSPRVS